MGEKRILVTFDEELMEGVMSFKKKKWIQNQQNTFDLRCNE
jgi:hypothetical protein